MPTGHVKFVNPKQRFAFIVPDDGSADVYVRTKIGKGQRLALRKGDRVSFETTPDERNGKLAARQVVKI